MAQRLDRHASILSVFACAVRRSGDGARGGGNLWGDELCGNAENSRDRFEDRPRSAAGRRVEVGRGTGDEACGRRRDTRGCRRCGSHPIDGELAIRSKCHRSDDLCFSVAIAFGCSAPCVLLTRSQGYKGGSDGRAQMRMSAVQFCSQLSPELWLLVAELSSLKTL